jgi:hypothetical protein
MVSTVVAPIAAADLVDETAGTVRSSTSGILEEVDKIWTNVWPGHCTPVAVTGGPGVTLRPECLAP